MNHPTVGLIKKGCIPQGDFRVKSWLVKYDQPFTQREEDIGKERKSSSERTLILIVRIGILPLLPSWPLVGNE